MEAQLRTLRSEQDRQSRQIELLENRVVLAEDTVRQVPRAAVSSRTTIRISEDGQATRVPAAAAPANSHARPTDVRTIVDDAAQSPEDDTDDAPSADDNTPRPMVRAQGRERLADPANPIVLRGGDRIPMAPIPALPGIRPAAEPPAPPAGHGPRSELTVPLPGTDHPTTGVSSVRDPRSSQTYDVSLQLARTGRCRDAIDSFSSFLVRWPDHPYAENSLYWRAECILQGGDVRRAANEFEGLLQRFPSGNKAPDALYKLWQCYRRMGNEPRAQTYAARLLSDYPSSASADRLRAERTQ